MINFSAISNSALLGRALRLPLKLVPDGAAVPILQGPLKGKRWIAGSATHGCWLGSYESAKQEKMSSILRPGMVCWDVGANVGFYTLLFAELVGSTGRVFAFEPLDRNVDRLRQHVKINGYSNVQIFPSALGNFVGEVAFDPGPGASMGHVAAAGSINVPCTTPDTLIAACEAEPPDVIKIDVEGAEVDVLRGARQLLKSRPAIFLATHGTFAHRQSIELLLASGYEVSALDGGLPDHTDELVALPPGGFRS